MAGPYLDSSPYGSLIRMYGQQVLVYSTHFTLSTLYTKHNNLKYSLNTLDTLYATILNIHSTHYTQLTFQF